MHFTPRSSRFLLATGLAAASPGGKSNPNQWFVFTFTDTDLAGSVFVPQRWVGKP